MKAYLSSVPSQSIAFSGVASPKFLGDQKIWGQTVWFLGE